MISIYDLIPYFRPVQLGEVKSDKYLRYFPGGWKGVKKRFGDHFRPELKKLSGKTLQELSGFVEFDPNIFQEIMKKDYRRMDSKVLEVLTNGLSFSIDQGLGKPIYSAEDRAKILQEIYNRKIIGFGTVVNNGRLEHRNNDDMSPDFHVNMYLALMAFDEI